MTDEVPEELKAYYRTGGFFNHDQLRLRLILDKFADDPDLTDFFPRTAEILRRLGEILYEITDEIDLVLSGNKEKLEGFDTALEVAVAGVLKDLNEGRAEVEREIEEDELGIAG